METRGQLQDANNNLDNANQGNRAGQPEDHQMQRYYVDGGVQVVQIDQAAPGNNAGQGNRAGQADWTLTGDARDEDYARLHARRTGDPITYAKASMPPASVSSAPSDMTLTREIRQSIENDDSLSTDANDFQVISENGVVTLRGSVDDAREKASIVSIARRTPGVSRVNDQLQIARY